MAAKTVIVIAALHCELKFLVESFGLKQAAIRPFKWYTHAESEIVACVCGVGSLNMATAVGMAAGMFDGRSLAWLNLGIVGHKDLELGSCRRVHSVESVNDDRKYYPPMTLKSPLSSAALLSVNHPTHEYPDSQMVDMEGVSFFNSATKFSDGELVQSIKVVSDNPKHSFEDLDANRIESLMRQNRETIVQFCEALMATQITQANPIDLEAFEHFSMSHSQQLQLQQLLKSLDVLGLDAMAVDIKHCVSIKQVLKLLKEFINAHVPTIDGKSHSRG